MYRVNVKEVRKNLRALIDRAGAGEEIIFLRRGKEVARLVPPKRSRQRLPSLEAFRRSVSPKGKALSDEVISGREEERY